MNIRKTYHRWISALLVFIYQKSYCKKDEKDPRSFIFSEGLLFFNLVAWTLFQASVTQFLHSYDIEYYCFI